MSASTRSDFVSATRPARNAQQPADVEVLARLRHHRLVGGHDEHHEVDAADAGEHVLDEALVAGHVDEREVDVADRQVREAEIDRDAARLFFLQPVGIGAGQRLDQRGLAVIDVAGGADDDRLHGPARSTRAARVESFTATTCIWNGLAGCA